MTVQLGQAAPDATTETTAGPVRFHDGPGECRLALSSRPEDCTTARGEAARHKVASPANCRKGDHATIVPSVTDERAKARFPQGWRAQKPLLRWADLKEY